MVLPLLLILPLAAFHIYVIVWVGGLEQASADDITFPESRAQVSTFWTEGRFRVDRINIQAWVETLLDLAIMVIVVVLDCLQLETITQLHVDADALNHNSIDDSGLHDRYIF